MPDNPYRSPEHVGEAAASAPTVAQRIWFWLFSLAVIVLLVALMLPSVRTARGPTRRAMCLNNLKQIGLALHNYHDDHGAFPPAYTVDEAGNRLHSWRTLLLPYLEHQQLYESIDLTKPWDDPANAAPREAALPYCYECPSAFRHEPKPSYVAVVCPEGLFTGSQAKTFADIKDGTPNTIAIVEMDGNRATHWMEPVDATLEEFIAVPEQGHSRHPGGFQAAYADGHGDFLSEEIDPAILRALVTIAGGEGFEQLGDY